MQAVVVYESLWGNTARIAQAIAEGMGPDARALATDEATPEIVAAADLVVAGAPVIAFQLPTEGARERLRDDPGNAPVAPDLSHPSMRAWLEALPRGQTPAAAFETRIWWSPRGSTGTIERGLRHAGYRVVSKARKFVVNGAYGPLRDGELDRARRWGEELAASIG
jgi:hypothetical protein